MKKACVFCGSKGNLSKEHVYPLWLQKYVYGNRKAGFSGTHLNLIPGSVVSERFASMNTLVFSEVCQNCNSGWMSRLEGDFAKLLTKLEHNVNPNNYTKKERGIIGLWCTKTALMCHYSANYRHIVPREIAKNLLKGSSLPKGIVVFGGKTQNIQGLEWCQSSLQLVIIPSKTVSYSIADKIHDHTFQISININDLYLKFVWHGLQNEGMKIGLPKDENSFYPHPKQAKELKIFENLISVGMNTFLES